MNNMKIGFPNHPRKDILEEIEWIGENKFDFVDLFLEEDMAVPEKIDTEKVKELLKKYGLGVVGHTAWYLPIGSPIKSLRDTAVKEAKRYFKVFEKIGVKQVTIHSNWPPSSMYSQREGIGFQVGTLSKLVAEAKTCGISIVYEPIDTPNDGLEAVSEVLGRVSGLYLHLDIGHSNLFGRKPEEFIEKLHVKMKHVHLHDNDGNKDLHLPVGSGNIDWKSVIKALKKYYDGTITLEIFSKDKNDALLSKGRITELWKSS